MEVTTQFELPARTNREYQILLDDPVFIADQCSHIAQQQKERPDRFNEYWFRGNNHRVVQPIEHDLGKAYGTDLTAKAPERLRILNYISQSIYNPEEGGPNGYLFFTNPDEEELKLQSVDETLAFADMLATYEAMKNVAKDIVVKQNAQNLADKLDLEPTEPFKVALDAVMTRLALMKEPFYSMRTPLDEKIGYFDQARGANNRYCEFSGPTAAYADTAEAFIRKAIEFAQHADLEEVTAKQIETHINETIDTYFIPQLFAAVQEGDSKRVTECQSTLKSFGIRAVDSINRRIWDGLGYELDTTQIKEKLRKCGIKQEDSKQRLKTMMRKARARKLAQQKTA